MKNILSWNSKNIKGNSNIGFDLRVPKVKSVSLYKPNLIKKKTYKPKISTKYKVNKTRQMTWPQLKQKFPGLSPYTDADFDGLVNSRDCRPFDPSKDGRFSEFIGGILKGKKKEKIEGEESDRTYKKAERKEAATQKYLLKEKKAAELRSLSKASAQEIIDRARTKGVTVGGVEKKTKSASQLIEEVRREKQAEKKIIEQGQSRFQTFKQKVEEAKAERATIKKEKRGKIAEAIEKVQAKSRALSRKFKPQETVVGKVLSKIKEPSGKEKARIKARRKAGLIRTVERFAGVREAQTKTGKTAKGVKGVGAGRPKGSYKYRDPRTGQPVTAVQYHKLRKQLRSQAKAVETKTEVKQRFALARRGLSPEEVAEAQEQMNARMARLRAIKEAKQMPQTEHGDREEGQEVEEAQTQVQDVPESQIPVYGSKISDKSGSYASPVTTSQYIEQSTAVPGSHGIPPGYRVQDDIMTGRKKLVQLPQPEAWTQ